MKLGLRPLLPLLNLVAAVLLLMGAAFADGRPSVFYDSDSYELAGRNFLEVIQKAPDSLNFKMKPGLDIGDDPVTLDDELDPNMMGARSAWYGLVLRGLFNLGTLWLLAAVQAFAVAWVLRLLWRSTAPSAPAWSYLALIGGLSLCSTLPFFTSFAMPDVFAGVAGAVIVLFMLFWDRLKWPELIGLWLLLVAIMSFHGTHPILAVPVTLVSALVAWRLGASLTGQTLRGLAVLAAAVLGLLAVKGYGAAFEVRSGRELRHPPFVAARLLVDGPAKRYLLTHCTDDVTPFVLCRYRFQPMGNTDTVLWSDEPELGVFNIADPRTRLLMEQQEIPFALAVVAYDPLGQIAASARDWLEQVANFWVEDPIRNPQAILRDPYWSSTALRALIFNAGECKPWGPGCAPPFYVATLAVWHGMFLILSLGFMGWRLTRRDVLSALRRPDWNAPVVRLVAVALVLVFAVLVNAAICGALSGVFTRYQARVVWLVPLSAGLVATVLVPYGAIAATRAWLDRMQARLLAWGRRQKLPAWAEPILARVVAHPLARFVTPQMLQFAVVGGVGFLLHTILVQLLTGLAYLNPILAWLIGFGFAMSVTWTINRGWTFKAHANDAKQHEEASTYLAVQCFAASVNFGVYWAIESGVPLLASGIGLVVPMAAGTAAGMGINYFGSRYLVFRHRPEASPAE